MKTNIALIGLGYWGPNLLRNFNSLGVLKSVFDLDSDKIEKFEESYNNVYFGTDWEPHVKDKRFGIDAVAIATPPETHCDIAIRALNMGKHVFIEKPMTATVEEAEKIIKVAKKKNKIVMVGHTFLYTPEVRKIKELIDAGELGDIQYIHALRLNLGKFQKSNVVMDLAPHDLSIFNYLLNSRVRKTHTKGYSFIDKKVVEVAFLTLEYDNGSVCHLHLSWLDPLKTRTTTIVGTKKMLIYDMLAEEKIKVYDKGVDVDNISSYGDYLLTYRHGDIWSPHTKVWEPLGLECKHFIECIETNKTPLTDGENGLEVVKALSGAMKSLKTGVEVWL